MVKGGDFKRSFGIPLVISGEISPYYQQGYLNQTQSTSLLRLVKGL
jgi:hypothetical protein